jgi:uncharacterized membrane protein
MSDGPMPQASPESIASPFVGKSIDIAACLSRGWNLVLENPGPLIGGTLLVFCGFFVLQFVPTLGWMATLVLTGPVMAGLYYTFLRRIRGETVGAADVFNGLQDNFLQLSLAGFISSLLVAIGFALCILPGIFLVICYMFVLPLAIDKKLEFWAAMEVSRRVVQAQWFTFFGLGIVCVLVVIAGALACLVGLIVALPVFIATIAYAYEDVFGQRTQS